MSTRPAEVPRSREQLDAEIERIKGLEGEELLAYQARVAAEVRVEAARSARQRELDKAELRTTTLSAIMDGTANVSKALEQAYQAGWEHAGGDTARCDFDCDHCRDDVEDLDEALVDVSERARIGLAD